MNESNSPNESYIDFKHKSKKLEEVRVLVTRHISIHVFEVSQNLI